MVPIARPAPRPAVESQWNAFVRFAVNADKCVSCLACVRVCPADAVAVDGTSVKIVDEACVRCGLCVPACPHDAIDTVGDLARALSFAARGDAVLILSVEAAAHFYPHTPEQVVNACYQAGFRVVHRGVLGDELVAGEYQKLWADPDWGTMIRSTCPVVVATIRHEYPELVPYLAPVKTPVAAEADYLQGMYGTGVPIVYAGVCLADGAGTVDALLTFRELQQLLDTRGVTVEAQPLFFDRIPEERRRHVSTAGGLPLNVLQESPQASHRFRKLRGLSALGALARAVAVERMDLGFVDILPCEGCLDHPLLGPKEELYWRRRVVGETEPQRSKLPVLDPAVVVNAQAAFLVERNGHHAAAAEIAAVIQKIGTAPTGKPWDCGACGLRTCAEFAEAMLNGRATLRQCVPYQEKRVAEAQAEAAVDDLTGLATFRVLRDRLKQEEARSRRSQEPFAVVFTDLDRFKRLNDTFGHEAGNRVLEAVGKELLRCVRSTDIAARYGGDEFVTILVRTDIAGARRVGEVIRKTIEALGRAMGYELGVVTVSVGVTGFDPRKPQVPDVLEEADKALYRAKAAGGNAVA